jgi:hypothetical protein
MIRSASGAFLALTGTLFIAVTSAVASNCAFTSPGSFFDSQFDRWLQTSRRPHAEVSLQELQLLGVEGSLRQRDDLVSIFGVLLLAPRERCRCRIPVRALDCLQQQEEARARVLIPRMQHGPVGLQQWVMHRRELLPGAEEL